MKQVQRNHHGLASGGSAPGQSSAWNGDLFYLFLCRGAALAALAGLSRDLTGNPAAPLLFGGTSLLAGIIILGLFRTFQRRGIGMAS